MHKPLLFGMLLLAFGVPSLALAASDKTPPKLTFLHIGSSNANPSIANPGDKVTISLTANEKVTTIVLVESRTLLAKALNTGGNSWDETYTVDPKDPAGKVDYLITLIDTSGNILLCTSAKLPIQIIPRCQTTDGSSVTVVKNVQPPADTVAPVIAAQGNISLPTAHKNTPVVVTYANPTATDNVDLTVAVTCAPASGSSFNFGTTTVTCNARDAAGNNATPVTFDVGVYFIPQPYVISSQTDASFLCVPNWRDCFTGGASHTAINLGLGSTLGGGSLKSVTFTKDAASPFVNKPWIVEIFCYTDNTYTTLCNDWTQPNANNGFSSYQVSGFTDPTPDPKYWTADFTNASLFANSDGSSPVVFNPNYYYQLQINDNGWSIGAWGSESLSIPYYVIEGMTQ
jgi:hypothetical protein